jgi:hypothetical protein
MEVKEQEPDAAESEAVTSGRRGGLAVDGVQAYGGSGGSTLKKYLAG